MFWKYGLTVKGYTDCNGLAKDRFWVEGDSWNVDNYDYTTLYYGYGTCIPDSPDGDGKYAHFGGTTEFIRIYPNPAVDHAILEINNTVDLISADLVIFDLLGNVMQKILNINSHEIHFDLSGLSQGIYFYAFINNGEAVDKGKIILTK